MTSSLRIRCPSSHLLIGWKNTETELRTCAFFLPQSGQGALYVREVELQLGQGVFLLEEDDVGEGQAVSIREHHLLLPGGRGLAGDQPPAAAHGRSGDLVPVVTVGMPGG